MEKTKLEFVMDALRQQTDECICVPGKLDFGGYSVLPFKGKLQGAHRVALILHAGVDMKGMHACHKCNVRNCVNPRHLYFGSAKENGRDRVISGSVSKKLTPHQVAEVFTKAKNGHTSKSLAKEYGVSRAAIQAIMSRRSWSAVTENL